MAPHTVPAPLSSTQSPPQDENYRKLKRRFYELEEETNSDPHRSGERNVRLREEREYLLQEMSQLEQQAQAQANGSPVLSPASPGVPMAHPSSSALPRTLLNPKARTSFVANLRQAIEEDDDGDDDPMLSSRHLGPQAQSRLRDESRRGEEGGREARKSGRRRPSSASQAISGTDVSLKYSPEPQDPGHSPRRSSPSRNHHSFAHPTSSHPHHSRQALEQRDQDIPMDDLTRGDAPLRSRSDDPPTSNGRETRASTRQQTAAESPRKAAAGRKTRNESAAIVKAAAAAAEAEAAEDAAAIAAVQSIADAINSSNGVQQRSQARPSRAIPQDDVQMADGTTSGTVSNNSPTPKQSTSSSSAPASIELLAQAAQEVTNGLNGENTIANTNTGSPSTSTQDPAIQSIVRVAEAAVAAQAAQAAAESQAAIASQATSPPAKAGVDPNLDPSLYSDTSNSASTSGSKAANKPATIDTTTTTAAPSKSATTPTSSTPLSGNPYMALSMLPRQGTGSTTPTAHPILMPYPMYFPPGTPVTPNTPGYPVQYPNPYYYLAGPMVPGPNGMYPMPGYPPPPSASAPPRPNADSSKTGKPKRLKAHTVTTKSFSIPMVPRGKEGKPMLPLNVGIMTVINLGDVCMREHFHTERYIFPVGYEVTRRYLSTVDPTIEVVYHCTILDGGDGPKFQIIPSDRADKPVIAGTATGAWSSIVKQANAIRNRQHSNSVSGPDFFGLGQNTIKHLIQQLPNADRLRNYVWQNFVEGGPLGGRHAAVIPALPEEYDASLPLGAYYPKRDTSGNPNVPRGMAHYPQHIIAQAEAQKAQRLAGQNAEAGPSGSGASASPVSQQQQTQAGGETLTVKEYQPPQQQGEKRATRSAAGANASAGAGTSSSTRTSGRHTRSASRGNQQQGQQQQQEQQQQHLQQRQQFQEQMQQQHFQQQIQQVAANNLEPATPSPSAALTTFAGLMNAYPVPGVVPPATNVPTQATNTG